MKDNVVFKGVFIVLVKTEVYSGSYVVFKGVFIVLSFQKIVEQYYT